MMEKKEPFQEIEIQQPEMIGESAIVKKYSAMVTDAKDQAVYNAIIDAAKKAGINSLLLMDRRFVLNALEVAIKRQEMLDSCSDAPTIEAEPVRHGKWIAKKVDATTTEFQCSECGREVKCGNDYFMKPTKHVNASYPYCHCGAKMDLEG